MPVSRLLKSCAIPPASWPTASIFCAWRSCSSLRRSASSPARRSVMSSLRMIAPAISASRLRSGTAELRMVFWTPSKVSICTSSFVRRLPLEEGALPGPLPGRDRLARVGPPPATRRQVLPAGVAGPAPDGAAGGVPEPHAGVAVEDPDADGQIVEHLFQQLHAPRQRVLAPFPLERDFGEVARQLGQTQVGRARRSRLPAVDLERAEQPAVGREQRRGPRRPNALSSSGPRQRSVADSRARSPMTTRSRRIAANALGPASGSSGHGAQRAGQSRRQAWVPRPAGAPRLRRRAPGTQASRSNAVDLDQADDAVEHRAELEPGGDLFEQPALAARQQLGPRPARWYPPARRPCVRRRRPRRARSRRGHARGRTPPSARRNRYWSDQPAAPRAMAVCIPVTTRSRSSACNPLVPPRRAGLPKVGRR